MEVSGFAVLKTGSLLFLSRLPDHDNHHVLIEELRLALSTGDNLSQRIASGERHFGANRSLHGSDVRAGLGLEEHLSGHVSQHQRQDGTRPLQRGLRLPHRLPGRLLAGGKAARQQVGFRAVADSGVHAE